MDKDLLRFIRSSLGYNQEQMAHRLSISKVYCSYLEQGRRPITVNIEQKILNTFSISKDELSVYKQLQTKRK